MHTAYFWADHGEMTFGIKLTRDTPWGEDTPLFQEMDCLLHTDCTVVLHAVSERRYAFLQAESAEVE